MYEKIPESILVDKSNFWINGKQLNKDYRRRSFVLSSGLIDNLSLNHHMTKNNTLSCLSFWKEYGDWNISYNPSMKNSPVKLKRVENIVNIQIALSFYGPLANVFMDSNSKTYAEIAFEGIKNVWNTFIVTPDKHNYFGDYDELYVNFKFVLHPPNDPSPHIKIFIKETGQPICLYNLFWRVSGSKKLLLDDITLRTFFKRKLTINEFMLQAAHEVGHILGLGDAYEGIFRFPLLGTLPQQQAPITFPANTEVPLDEVMRSGWHSAKVYPNTIEMILEAFKTNKLQKYDPRSHSKVIRSY